MTRNSIFKNNKSKLILILLLIASMCFSMFAVACDKGNDDKSERPTYTHTEKYDGIISNPNFNFGTSKVELKDFPKTSPTGWSRSKDSDSNIGSSSATSGIINVSEDGWKEFLNALYKDSAILDYVLTTNDVTKDKVKELIKADTNYNPDGKEDYKPSDSDVKKYTIENYISKTFTNPSTNTADADKLVYMLNNYRSKENLGLGTAQKITSSSTITLEKGSYGKLSVWVKTVNILEGDNVGANIRISSTFNGTSQAEYALTNIVTSDWKEYVIYVKADEQFDTTFKVALGLGYGLNGITQGTAYFDNVKFEELETAPDTTNFDVTNFVYNGEDKIVKNAKEVTKSLLYTVSINDYITANASTYFTTVNNLEESKVVLAKGTKAPIYTVDVAKEESPYGKAVKATKIDFTGASATLTYDGFTQVGTESYAFVTFAIKNELKKFGSTDITVNVYDMLSGKKDIVTRGIATASNVSDEWQKVNVLIKNNFVDDNDPSTTNDVARNYKIEIVIGPTILSDAKFSDDFASGTVTITTPQVASGKIFASQEKAEEASQETVYGLYNLYSGTANGTVALYAGLTSDYKEDSNNESYAFSIAPSDIGSILTHPANVNGYQGIVANHIYVKDGGTVAEINTRTTGFKNEDNSVSYAGLINTDYNYSISGLSDALNFNATDDEESIQPLMIYNASADNYGFIGTSNTISASSYAKVSVTLRVVDDAVANIYLVESNNKEKNVLTFGGKINGEDIDKELSIKVTEDMMAQNGWVTVDFYIATGVNSKTFRVELWNGYRDGDATNSSKGFVFFKNVTVTTSSGFSESTRLEDTFTVSGNPLYTEKIIQGESLKNTILYTRALTDTEKQFNSEQKSSEDKVSYSENYIWAQTDTMIYAIYNTIEPVEVDPYDNVEDEETKDSGCTAQTDPSTFWLSFSTILLGVALVLAILMLFIKNIRRRRKANASDAKSHYTITSRTKAQRKIKKSEETSEPDKQVEDEVLEETESEVAEEENVEEQKEDDSYVYGDVQVFGDKDSEENK